MSQQNIITYCPNTEFSHRLIGDAENVLPAQITADIEHTKTLDGNVLVVDQEASLSDVLYYYLESYGTKEVRETLIVNAATDAEAMVGIENRMQVVYGNRTIDARTMEPDELAVAKLSVYPADAEEAQQYAKKALVQLLRNFPFVTVVDAVDAVSSANTAVDVEWAYGFANWLIDTRTNAILSTKKISDELAEQCRQSWAPLVKITDYLSAGLWVDRSATGKGKSTRAEQIARAALDAGLTVVVVCHRISISDRTFAGEASIIPEAVHYKNIKPGTEKDIKCLKIVVNSLTKPNLREFLANVDIIIMEESKQELDHVGTGSVRDRYAVINTLKSVCSSARSLIMLDADNNDLALGFAQKVKPLVTPHLLSHRADFSGKKMRIACYDQVIAEISKTVGTQPVMIATDVKKQVNKLTLQFAMRKDRDGNAIEEENKVHPDRILKIHADTMNQEQSDFIREPNAHADKYDLIIFNSAVTSSVSLTKHRFKKTFGLFTGIITSSNCIQMLRRNRPCDDFLIGLRPQKEQLIADYDELLPDDPTDDDRFFARVEAQENLDKNDNMLAFYVAAKEAGFDVQVVAKDAAQEAKGKAINHAATIREATDYRRRMQNTKASDTTVSQEEQTSTTADCVRRAAIEQNTGMEKVSDQDITREKRGGLAHDIENIEIMRGLRDDCVALDQEQEGAAKRDLEHYAGRHDAFNLIFETLGIDPLTLEGEYNAAKAGELLDKLYANRKTFNKLKNVKSLPTHQPDKPIQTVNNILIKTFGVKLTNRKNPESTTRERLYSIKSASAEALNTYTYNRAVKGFSVVKAGETPKAATTTFPPKAKAPVAPSETDHLEKTKARIAAMKTDRIDIQAE